MSIIKPLKIQKIKGLKLDSFETDKKDLSNNNLTIKYVSCDKDDKLIYLHFEVEAKSLRKGNATIFVKEMSATNEFAVHPCDIKIVNGKTYVKASFPKSTEFDRYSLQDGFVFQATITCDGFSAETEEFKLKFPKESINTLNTLDKPLAENDLISMDVPSKTAKEYINVMNATFDEYNINTHLRKISFFGQVLSETEAFRIKSESGVSDSDYGGFKGRGCMQLTGKSNYVGYEEYKKKDNPNIDFTSSTSNKDKINELPYYLDSGGWFWSIKVELNDDADRNDFIYIGYRVNGGFNHFDKRVDYYIKAAKVLDKKYEKIIFNFKDSYCYNIPKASFGWGLWHDPSFPSNKFKGVTRDANIAKQAYKRFLELHIKAGNPKLPKNGWYGIKDIVSFVNQRLNSL